MYQNVVIYIDDFVVQEVEARAAVLLLPLRAARAPAHQGQAAREAGGTVELPGDQSRGRFPPLKGTVQRDFLTPVFFTKRLVLVSIDMPRSDFEIFRIFAELFVLKLLKNQLPAFNYSEESKTEP